jgi:hypothetical protein
MEKTFATMVTSTSISRMSVQQAMYLNHGRIDMNTTIGAALKTAVNPREWLK